MATAIKWKPAKFTHAYEFADYNNFVKGKELYSSDYSAPEYEQQLNAAKVQYTRVVWGEDS